MRYYLDTTTLFIRGPFRAASTGISGGIRSVTTLFNDTVPAEWDHASPIKEIELVTAAAGTGPAVLGLLTAVPIRHLCVLQDHFITVFVTAGHPGGAGAAGQPEPERSTSSCTAAKAWRIPRSLKRSW